MSCLELNAAQQDQCQQYDLEDGRRVGWSTNLAWN